MAGFEQGGRASLTSHYEAKIQEIEGEGPLNPEAAKFPFDFGPRSIGDRPDGLSETVRKYISEGAMQVTFSPMELRLLSGLFREKATQDRGEDRMSNDDFLDFVLVVDHTRTSTIRKWVGQLIEAMKRDERKSLDLRDFLVIFAFWYCSLFPRPLTHV